MRQGASSEELGEDVFKGVLYDYGEGAGFLREFRRSCRASMREEEIAENYKTAGLIYGRDYVSFYHCFKEAQSRIMRAIMSGV